MSVLPNAVLNINGEDKGKLHLASFQTTLSADNEVILVFNLTSDESKALLWQALHMRNESQPLLGFSSKAISLESLPARGLYTEEARQQRLDFIRKSTSAKLDNIKKTSFQPQQLVGNIESFLGSLEIPIGISGPLLIKGQRAKGVFYAPMATSEGALVASATRGAYAVSLAGGVVTRILGQRMQRVPMFVFENVDQAILFKSWVTDYYPEIKVEAEKYSNHANLVQMEAQILGKAVHVHFIYETGDAAGQNMTTTCTWQACLWITEKIKFFSEIKVKNFIIEGGVSGDKKVCYQNFIHGRGIKVQAEVVIPAKIFRRIFKCTPQEGKALWDHYVYGSIGMGMVGINGNVANVIAAVFAATGQDIACVHESALANTVISLTDEGDLYFNMIFPGLVVGTVGGGTNLPHQKECLEILGCVGPGSAGKLAEIIAGYCLALDISTMTAVAAGQFADAHERLGRNRVVNHLKLGDLNETFFEFHLRNSLNDPAVQVNHLQLDTSYETQGSIFTQLASQKLDKTIGLFPFNISYLGSSGEANLDVMVKIKPTAADIFGLGSQLVAMCDARLAFEYEKHQNNLGIDTCDKRELAVMSQSHPLFVANIPRVYGVYQDLEREAFVVIQELLVEMELMNSVDNVSDWTEQHLQAAIRGAAECHAVHYDRVEELKKEDWLGCYPTTERRLNLTRLYELLAAHAMESFPEWVDQGDVDNYRAILYSAKDWWPLVEEMPRTLIHNDFNPRNICFRKTDGGLRLCAYDWELATLHIPQCDLAELLAFTLPDNVSAEHVKALVEYHRKSLEAIVAREIDSVEWWCGFRFAVWDFILAKLSIYLMMHTFLCYRFIERVHATARRLLEIVGPA